MREQNEHIVKCKIKRQKKAKIHHRHCTATAARPTATATGDFCLLAARPKQQHGGQAAANEHATRCHMWNGKRGRAPRRRQFLTLKVVLTQTRRSKSLGYTVSTHLRSLLAPTPLPAVGRRGDMDGGKNKPGAQTRQMSRHGNVVAGRKRPSKKVRLSSPSPNLRMVVFVLAARSAVTDRNLGFVTPAPGVLTRQEVYCRMVPDATLPCELYPSRRALGVCRHADSTRGWAPEICLGGWWRNVSMCLARCCHAVLASERSQDLQDLPQPRPRPRLRLLGTWLAPEPRPRPKPRPPDV